MLDYTYTNLVLMIGGQLLFIILGVLVITFGLSTDFPLAAAGKLLSASEPAITHVNNIKRVAVAFTKVKERVLDK